METAVKMNQEVFERICEQVLDSILSKAEEAAEDMKELFKNDEPNFYKGRLVRDVNLYFPLFQFELGQYLFGNETVNLPLISMELDTDKDEWKKSFIISNSLLKQLDMTEADITKRLIPTMIEFSHLVESLQKERDLKSKPKA